MGWGHSPSSNHCDPVLSPRRVARWAYGGMSLLFLSVNVACASLGERNGGTAGGGAWRLVLLRVLVNDLLFILEAVAMAVLLLQLTRMAPSTSPYLHSKVRPSRRKNKYWQPLL